MKPIGWLARTAEPYAVWHNDEEFAGVERLAFTVKLIGEAWREEIFACSRGAVQKKNGVVDGGSRDATVRQAELRVDKVILAPRGRALQMNAGADACHAR